jgi:quercetin dioxygenase-like cupin family protein
MQTKYPNVGADRAPGSVPEPFAVNLEYSPVEGADDSQSGQLTWRTLISGDRSPSDQLIIGVADFPPHGRLNMHRHEPAEFYFGLSGEGTVVAKGIEYRIAKGIAVFIPGNTDHGVVAGQGGLSILYGFARRAFSEIVYDYGEGGAAPNSGVANVIAESP